MKKSNVISFLILFCFLLNNDFVNGQNRLQIDSIKSLNQVETNKEYLVYNYNTLAEIFSPYQIDSAFFYVTKGLHLSKQINYKSGEAESYFLLSSFNNQIGNRTEAINNLEKACEIYIETGDSSYLVACYNNLGVLYSYGKNQEKSLMYFIQALNLAEELNETYSLSEAYSNVGSFYEYIKEYSSALKYYQKSLDVDIETNDTENIPLSYLYIGNIYLKLHRYDIAFENLTKAKQRISSVKNQYRQTEIFINLAYYFLETNQLDSAKNYIQFAKDLNRKIDYENLDATILSLEGDYSLKQKNYKECLAFYDSAIEIYNKQNTIEGLSEIYQAKSESYQQLGNHNLAYQSMLRSKELNDSLKSNGIAKILGEFEYAESTKEERAQFNLEQQFLNQKNENDLIRIRTKLYFAVFSIVALVFLVVIGIFHFILRRKRNKLLAENYKKLEISEKKLTELNATKDKFFSIIAHDLKNPFNVLIGISDILLHNPDLKETDKFNELVEGMFQAANSGHNLLENLLEWARSQTGDISYHPEILNVNDLIKINTAFFQESVKTKEIEILVHNLNNEKVFADKNMVNVAFRNLLSNAIKYSYAKSKIEINVNKKDKFYIFTIQDFGVGINKEDLQKLFAIDETKQKTGTANEKGTGLGLILCKEFIEKNRGEIWVESTEGKGSKFNFSLPAFINN